MSIVSLLHWRSLWSCCSQCLGCSQCPGIIPNHFLTIIPSVWLLAVHMGPAGSLSLPCCCLMRRGLSTFEYDICGWLRACCTPARLCLRRSYHAASSLQSAGQAYGSCDQHKDGTACVVACQVLAHATDTTARAGSTYGERCAGALCTVIQRAQVDCLQPGRTHTHTCALACPAKAFSVVLHSGVQWVLGCWGIQGLRLYAAQPWCPSALRIPSGGDSTQCGLTCSWGAARVGSCDLLVSAAACMVGARGPAGCLTSYEACAQCMWGGGVLCAWCIETGRGGGTAACALLGNLYRARGKCCGLACIHAVFGFVSKCARKRAIFTCL